MSEVDLHDLPLDPAHLERGGWARCDLTHGRHYYGFVREIRGFGVSLIEILEPHMHTDDEADLVVHVHTTNALDGVHPLTKEDCLICSPRTLAADLDMLPPPPAAPEQTDA